MKRYERPTVNRAEMVDGDVYDACARNLRVGVWNAKASRFIGIRENSAACSCSPSTGASATVRSSLPVPLSHGLCDEAEALDDLPRQITTR